MPSIRHTTIIKRDFDTILSRYPSKVSAKLHDLDKLRYEAIPATVAQRLATQHNGDENGEGVYLKKEEVEKLVQWKLSHGTFRPSLLKLVLSNEPNAIESATRDAFRTMSQPTPREGKGTLASAVQLLTSLRGIGPATASLLLAVHNPDGVPFFSDELFRWVMWDEKDGGADKWKRKIKYNLKEYEGLVKKAADVMSRLGVKAVDCERVAWVLGKEEADVGADADNGDLDAGAGDEQAGEQDKNMPRDIGALDHEKAAETDNKISVSRKQGVKRKVVETNPQPGGGVRRSTRRRKDTQ